MRASRGVSGGVSVISRHVRCVLGGGSAIARGLQHNRVDCDMAHVLTRVSTSVR